MRHRKKTLKLGRTAAHRDALLASLAANLIKYRRIRTTVAKAKAARPFVEKLVTLGKRGTLATRRMAAARLQVRGPGAQISGDKDALQRWHKQRDVLRMLFEDIAPAFKDRQGGYTRIIRLERRGSDSSEMALLEWVNYVPEAPRQKKKGKDKAAAGQAAAAPKEKKAEPAKK